MTVKQQTQLAPWEKSVQVAARRYSKIVASTDMTWAQERIFVEQAMRSSKDLQKALPDSIIQAILQSASMGLSLNPAKKHCYLIPRKAKRGSDTIVAYCSPSYMGLISLGVSSGAIIYGAAEIVFDIEDKEGRFVYKGPMEKPHHHPTIHAKDRTEAKAIGVYACVKLPSGDFRTEYMDRATIMKVKAMSENPNGAIWDANKWWTEGWKKAVWRRLMKTMQSNISTPMLEATKILDENEGLGREIVSESVELINDQELKQITDLLEPAGIRADRILKAFRIESLADMPKGRFVECMARLKDAKRIKEATKEATHE